MYCSSSNSRKCSYWWNIVVVVKPGTVAILTIQIDVCTSVHDCIFVVCVYLRFIVHYKLYIINLVMGAWPWHVRTCC